MRLKKFEPKDIEKAQRKLGLSQVRFANILGYTSSRRIRELRDGDRTLGNSTTILLHLYLGNVTIGELKKSGTKIVLD